MACKVHTNQHGRLTLILRWRGEATWEGTGERDTPAIRSRCEKIAKAVSAEIAAGTFGPARYLFYFPLGRRVAKIEAELGLSKTGGPSLRQYAEMTWMPRQVAPVVRKTQARDVRVHLKAVLDTPIEGGLKLGVLKVAEVEPAHIEAVRVHWLRQQKLNKDGEPIGPYAINTVKTRLGTLSKLLEDAWRVDKLREGNPCEDLSWPRRPKRKINPLTEEDRDRILADLEARGHYLLPFLTTLLYSGMRPSEAVALRWRDVDLRGGQISIGKSRVLGSDNATKTEGSDRDIRALDQVMAALRSLNRGGPNAFVFVGPTGRPLNQDRIRERHWAPMLQRLGIDSRTLYDCRSTFVSWALTRDANIKWLAEYCGTSVAMIEKHYGRFLRAREAEQLGKLSAKAKTLTTEAGSTGPIRKTASL